MKPLRLSIRIIIIIFFFININISAQDTTKVLFIGNSFTSANNLEQIFKNLTIGAGYNVDVAVHAPGGITVGDTNQGNQAHMANPQVYNLIRSNDWDYLVLQDNQGRFALSYGVFPASSHVIQGHIMLRDSFLHYHPCGNVLWFAGWGTNYPYPPYATGAIDFINHIYHNYQYLLDTAGQIIAPIGPAWKWIINNEPSISLFGSDDVHPGINGSFLTACVIYSSIFKESARNSNYAPAGMTVNIDTVLKNTAFQAVIDSFNLTGLRDYTPVIEVVGNQLHVNDWNTVDWFLNDTFLTSNQGVLPQFASGKYRVIAYDSVNCHEISFETAIQSTLGIYPNKHQDIVNIFPNPATDYVLLNSSSWFSIEIFDSRGRQVYEKNDFTESHTIPLNSLENGIYFVKLTFQDLEVLHRKLIKQ